MLRSLIAQYLYLFLQCHSDFYYPVAFHLQMIHAEFYNMLSEFFLFLIFLYSSCYFPVHNFPTFFIPHLNYFYYYYVSVVVLIIGIGPTHLWYIQTLLILYRFHQNIAFIWIDILKEIYSFKFELGMNLSKHHNDQWYYINMTCENESATSPLIANSRVDKSFIFTRYFTNKMIGTV